MSTALSIVARNPSIRACALAILFFGFSGAATAPYQAIVGIRELGLGDASYSALMFSAALINVIASVSIGILADRLGRYRLPMIYMALFGVAGYLLLYIFATPAMFVATKLFLLPVYGALYSMIFASVRTTTQGMSSGEVAAVNSTMRSLISLSWVLVPGLVGFMLAGQQSMLSAWLFSGLAAMVCLLLVVFMMPEVKIGENKRTDGRFGFFSSLGEFASRRVILRLVAVSLITSTLHVNDAVRPLIITGRAGGTVADIGVVVGIVAALEIVFILLWGWMGQRMRTVTALAVGATLYAAYLVLQGLATEPWHIYAQTPLSAFAAAAIISIPITFLQDLIADRPGLGSSLIAVNIFVSSGISSLLFAFGTWISDYSGTSILGALAGLGGVVMLLALDGKRR